MSIWKLPINLETLNLHAQNTLLSHLGIEYTEIGDDFLVGKMPVDYRTVQPFGILHGGASCVLAETLGSTAANYCVDNKDWHCVGLDINTNHIRPISKGFVFGIAKPYHIGRTTQVWHIEIRGEHDKLISVSRLTMAVIKKT